MMLAIDPGYNAMGWALFASTDLYVGQLVKAGVFQCKTKSKLPWHHVVDVWQQRLNEILGMKVIKLLNWVVCEEMMLFPTAGGYAAAATSLMGLAGTVGMWAAWAYRYNSQFRLAPILEWKGQLPKSVVNDRIAKLLAPQEKKLLTPKRSHDWDAAGIGLWHLGRFE